MDLNELQKPLTVNEIDFRIQSINNGGYATILAYKDARVDMQRLDDVCGVLGWKREHSRDNKNCTVSLWDKDNKHWVSKEDTGKESQAEAQKGLASDSFKRACFNLGIGRELYDYPIISIKLNKEELTSTGKDRPKYKASFDLNLKSWTWVTNFDNNKLIHLSCNDVNGNKRFEWNAPKGKLDITEGNRNVGEYKEEVGDAVKLSSCKTLSELQKVYQSMTTEKQAAFTALKDKLKLELK